MFVFVNINVKEEKGEGRNVDKALSSTVRLSAEGVHAVRVRL